MGGYGSTRWGWHRKRTTTDECRTLDAGRWQREGILGPDRNVYGGWQWSDPDTGAVRASIGYETRIGPTSGTVRLRYAVTPAGGEKEDLAYAVPVETTRPHYGGLRWWFRCPNLRCGRRVRLLYMAPGSRHFMCRHCQGLAYRSSQEHDKTRDRFMHMDPAALLAILRGDDPGDTIKAAMAMLDRDLGAIGRGKSLGR